MNIVVKKLPDSDVEIFIEVQPTMTVQELKQVIEEKIKIPCNEQKLCCYGRAVEDGTLAELNLIEGAVIILERKCLPEIQIFVKTMHSQTLTINIKPNDFVSLLRRKIIERLPGKKEDYDLFLIYGAKTLQDQFKLSYYDIGKESTIHVGYRLRGGKRAHIFKAVI